MKLSEVFGLEYKSTRQAEDVANVYKNYKLNKKIFKSFTFSGNKIWSCNTKLEHKRF